MYKSKYKYKHNKTPKLNYFYDPISFICPYAFISSLASWCSCTILSHQSLLYFAQSVSKDNLGPVKTDSYNIMPNHPLNKKIWKEINTHK